MKGRFPNVPFFYVASTQLPMPEFGLNSLKSCCSPNFRCNSSADIIHEHGARCQEDDILLTASVVGVTMMCNK